MQKQKGNTNTYEILFTIHTSFVSVHNAFFPIIYINTIKIIV